MDKPTSQTWIMRVWFLALAMLIMFFHLLPLDTLPRRWAPPDLLIAFVFAWALRRPDFVPVLSIAAVMLMADLMFQRPPGLLALLVLLGTENLRLRFAGLRDASFAGEWISVCIVLVAITVANRLVLALLAVQQAPLGLSLMQMLMTIAVYPLVVFITQSLFGVRTLAPSDADARAARA
ncbi:MAG: rod shape-determining protein MreD [Rhodobacteraceae bacterium]|nr:rod shape-determining protein MreD [Paracoccaceae bacterium]